jgi:hypothetical protein
MQFSMFPPGSLDIINSMWLKFIVSVSTKKDKHMHSPCVYILKNGIHKKVFVLLIKCKKSHPLLLHDPFYYSKK